MLRTVPTSMAVGGVSLLVAAVISIIAFTYNRDADEGVRQRNRALCCVYAIALIVGCATFLGFLTAQANDWQAHAFTEFWFWVAVAAAWVSAIISATTSWSSRRNQPRHLPHRSRG